VYSDKFAVAKPERTLEYKPMLGMVKLELEIGTRTVRITHLFIDHFFLLSFSFSLQYRLC
jgi:hypothetical protein